MLLSNFCSYMKNDGQTHVLFALKTQVLKFLRHYIKILTPLSLRHYFFFTFVACTNAVYQEIKAVWRLEKEEA